MVLEQKNQCFDFLNRYGYHWVQENYENYIKYVGNNNIVIIMYSEYSKEIYCQFEDIKAQKSFSLQDALDYQRINDMKGIYQISKNEEIYKGLEYLANAIEKVYFLVDISNSVIFNKIYDYTVEKRNKALNDYYVKEELRKADDFWKKNSYLEAQKLYKKNIDHLSKVQLQKLKICGINIGKNI